MRISRTAFVVGGIFFIILLIAIPLIIVVTQKFQKGGHPSTGGKLYSGSPIASGKAYYVLPTGGKAYYVMIRTMVQRPIPLPPFKKPLRW